jgi:vitamin B12 transporter
MKAGLTAQQGEKEKKMSRLTIALAAVFVLGLNSGAMAQEGGSSGRATVLDTVVVTAGRSEEQLKSVSQSVTVIDEKEIERTGAKNLPDLLKQQGLTFTQLGVDNGAASVSIRGIATQRGTALQNEPVLVLLDGRRIGTGNITNIPLDNIGRVEVLRGAAAVQYGTDAVGGVINLISKRGGEQFKAFAEQDFGTWDRAKTSLGFSGMVGDVDFSLGGSYYDAGPAATGDGSLYKFNNNGARRLLGGLNLGYNFNEVHRLGLVVSYADGIYARGSQIYELQNFPTDYNHDSRNDRKNFSWDLKYDGGLPEANLTWTARYYHGMDTETSIQGYSYYNLPVMPYDSVRGANRTSYDYTAMFDGASLSGSWNNELLYLTAGLEYYGIDYDRYVKPYYSSATATTPAAITGAHYGSSENYAGFLLAKVALLDETLWLSGGLRYDRYKVEMDPYNTPNNGEKTSAEKGTWNPSFGVSYLPLDWLKVRANYAHSFRMPQPMYQMGARATSATVAASNFEYLANPNLGPETAKSWDLGTDVYYGPLTLGLTYFSIDYEDEIAPTPNLCTAPGPPYVAPNVCSQTGQAGLRQYRNTPGTTEYRGLELYADWQMGETFGWNFELKPYIIGTRIFRAMNEDTELGIGSAGDSYSFGLVFDHEEHGLRASVDGTYYGHQLSSSSGSQVEYGGDTIWDLHLAKRLYEWPDMGRLTLKADIFNVGDKLYKIGGSGTATNLGYYGEGRSFMLGLRYEY